MIFQSKKATMTTVGAAIVILVTVILKVLLPDISDELMTAIIGLLTAILASYNIGQGIADHGKHRPPVVIETTTPREYPEEDEIPY